MVSKVDKTAFIPVDEWDTEQNPIAVEDRIFREVRGELILPLSEVFYPGDEDMKSIDYFVMSAKRSYNSDETRAHICRYLNYFEKYYDKDKELVAIISKLKIMMDFVRDYSKVNFMDDVNKYIICNLNLTRKIRHFVDDNYNMSLSNNNNKTPNLQFNDDHAKILYEISMLMNIYIPLATHYMYIHNIKKSEQIQDFMLELFDHASYKYEKERHIDIYNKIYETAQSVVNKSKNPDKPLWDKNLIRGINPTTHTKDSVHDIILQIMPKYTYTNNIINFNYYSNRQALRYKITDIAYEYQFFKLSSSKRDADQNSEIDRYEARLNKKDEALLMQNKVAAEQTVKRIEDKYGPFSDTEIEYYRKKLTKDGTPVINELQKQLIGYLYDKDFGDPITIDAIHNQTDYIKLVIAAKKMLLGSGMVILPYIISSKVTRTATRKVISKKEMTKMENSDLYQQIKAKYNNPKIEQKIWEFIGTIVSSVFEIIDFDVSKNKGSEIDGCKIPMINDLVEDELLFFISNI